MILHIPWEVTIVSLFSLIISKVEGEIHCYCNAPSCVLYSYMCKSDDGCYTEFIEDPFQGSRPYRHGCVQDLPENLCQTKEHINNTREILAVQCCTDDMCNYDKRVDRPVTIPEGNSNEVDNRNTQPYHSVNRAVWFRAAVIAVPIGGACILFILIILAARMLKNEEKHFERFNSGQKLPPYRPSIRQEVWDANNVKNITITDNNLELLHCKLNNTYIWKVQHESKQQNSNQISKNFSINDNYKMNIDNHDVV
ncbi:BMP and activin membrane-bound inhibitor homolog [Anneissia japonica]|uniref:BMP and activin membrane-bound inhibitor homolog n=1 Tax=Anneissia japonica TaxID=1529436 RepID=UPI00142583E3|nr:BMP and activin membrane-bound inhibitor homolog [Anneissia japonica]